MPKCRDGCVFIDFHFGAFEEGLPGPNRAEKLAGQNQSDSVTRFAHERRVDVERFGTASSGSGCRWSCRSSS